MIAHKSNSDEIVALRAAFEHYDTEKDGFISYNEFRAALKDSDCDDATLNQVFNSIVRVRLCRLKSILRSFFCLIANLPFLSRTFLMTL